MPNSSDLYSATDPLNKTHRIDVVDALRGFALMGIMLLHNVEKFNYMGEVDNPVAFFNAYDGDVWNFLCTFFAGKSYAIFSMLFGFSFWIQYSRKADKGYDMGGRFVWRMAILFAFGVVHSFYYSGDLLMFYATMGLLLVLLRKAPNWVCLTLSLILMALPVGLYHFAQAVVDPTYIPPANNASWPLWDEVGRAQANGSLHELIGTYITTGVKANVVWTWEAGRFFHIPGLFILGMLAARKKVFSDMSTVKWAVCAFALGLMAFMEPFFAKNLAKWGFLGEGAVEALGVVSHSYYDVLFTLAMVSTFVVLWRLRVGEWVFRPLIPYGRMSLTNYLSQGLFGLILYNGCTLALYHNAGAALSLCIGFTVFLAQLLFSFWCLRRYGQGPLEKVWRKLMWIGSSKGVAENKEQASAAQSA